MATRKGLVKKTELEAYSRPLKSGIIAIKLKEDDELVDVAITKPGDEVVLVDRQRHGHPLQRSRRPPDGPQHQRRQRHQPRARATTLVGMVVADPEATLLTACENGYGKRTPFGPNADAPAKADAAAEDDAETQRRSRQPPTAAEDEEAEGESSSGFRYRTQRRGGKGLRDIKTTDRNGPVIGIVPRRRRRRAADDDRPRQDPARSRSATSASIGRNTQGVRIMTLDEGDTLAAVVRVPKEENGGADQEAGVAADAGPEASDMIE